MLTQKEFEQKTLNLFRDLLPLKDISKVTSDEAPDFLVTINNNVLGIEITELYQPPPDDGIYIQQQEILKSRIVIFSQKILDNEDLPAIEIYVSFNDSHWLNIDTKRFKLTGKHVKEFPKLITNLIKENIPEEGDAINLYAVDNDELPIQINSLKISRHGFYSKPCINTSKGGIVPSLSSEYLQSIITGKNNKLANYLEKCDDCWLLISTDDFKYEKSFDLHASMETLEQSYEFDFGRVLILDEGLREIFELSKG